MILLNFIKKKLKLNFPNIFTFYTSTLFNIYNNENKFSYIYKKNIWGKKFNYKFYSGNGSHSQKIIKPYIKIINKILKRHKSSIVVDCGCGDFNVGKELFLNTKKYIGIDIFKDLIDLNKEKFIHPKLIFVKKDITKDKLPVADFCIVRQVLQHLSNEDILLFLKNIKNRYKFLIITEHLPKKKFLANKNIKTSFHIRGDSGVILHKPPFMMKFRSMKKIHEVSATPDPGIISTTLYTL